MAARRVVPDPGTIVAWTRPLRSSSLVKAACSAGFGALGAVALAPWHFAPLLVLSMSGLLWLLHGALSARRAFLLGWLYGLGYFVAGLHWVGESFQVDADRFGNYAVAAVLALSAFLALFPAVACYATVRIGGNGLHRWFVFAASWAATEWLRGDVFPAFPWNLVSSVWVPYTAPLQAASLIGPYALGFVTVVIASAVAVAVAYRSSRPMIAGRPLALALGCIAALWVFGSFRLPDIAQAPVDALQLRLVQPNIPQAMKWDSEYRATILERLRALSMMPAAAAPTAIIWPESALPIAINEAPPAMLRVVADVVPRGGVLITGADRRTTAPNVERAYANSVIALDDTGAMIAVYDKVRLVPFGEYMPFRQLLPFKGLAAGTVDFVPGPGPARLDAPGLPPFIPLVCYEAVFPAQRPAIERAQWLLNVTNDAWFGASAGPYQHFALARMRAVESGLPLVRAANTGISAVVDPYGRVLEALPLNVAGVLDARLPPAIAQRPMYARWGDVPLAVIIALVYVFVIFKRPNGVAAPAAMNSTA